MHELSIAQSILDIVEQHLPEDHQGSVKSIKLKVGELSGVVVESLEFCFSAVTAGTRFERAVLEIERIGLAARCEQCATVSPVSHSAFICQACGSNHLTIISGRELHVSELEIADNEGEET
jgi:hydrogenase nickel incorporation protein HypA/HybF